ncbi:hypothetical protein BO86DRAFT_208729 [Aspergillus japonicus CBS 114.51]|uniref:Uncharacterized protein n=1 Tax=Aspergillus japonicus CBS 114.51 TaxID=1448312 RepID=A0A8T8XBV0_ASPJA|nr:hypothetical protein BO86DRAFT_208729 [Aspergillus japonicus CBS 114.51]RAH84869.1 hypothetical protein BO86DRAFT_208729 [Aspergillus japonicus CBS 114.51]
MEWSIDSIQCQIVNGRKVKLNVTHLWPVDEVSVNLVSTQSRTVAGEPRANRGWLHVFLPAIFPAVAALGFEFFFRLTQAGTALLACFLPSSIIFPLFLHLVYSTTYLTRYYNLEGTWTSFLFFISIFIFTLLSPASSGSDNRKLARSTPYTLCTGLRVGIPFISALVWGVSWWKWIGINLPLICVHWRLLQCLASHLLPFSNG